MEPVYCKLPQKTSKRNRSTDKDSPDLTVQKKHYSSAMTITLDDLNKALKAQSDQLMNWFADRLSDQEKNWQAANNVLIERIEKLEKKEQSRERQEKRRNVVISGLECDKKNALQIAKQFLNDNLDIDPIKIRDVVRCIERRNNNIIIVEMETEADKWRAVNNGRLLQNKAETKSVYIRGDTTYAERQIQYSIRQKLKQLRSEGASIKREPKGVYTINNCPLSWSEEKMDFIPAKKTFPAGDERHRD